MQSRDHTRTLNDKVQKLSVDEYLGLDKHKLVEMDKNYVDYTQFCLGFVQGAGVSTDRIPNSQASYGTRKAAVYGALLGCIIVC